MQRCYWLWLVFMVCLMIFWPGIAEISHGQTGPDEVIINNNVYRTDIYESVWFRHGAHVLEFGIVCGSCHHAWNQEEKDAPNKCIDCHAVKDTVKVRLRDAYMNSCRGCHGRLKIEGKPSGPTRCNGCHCKRKLLR